MDSLWIPNGFPMDSLWIPYGFPMDSLWIPNGFPMDSLWIPYGFPMDSLWIPYINLLKNPSFGDPFPPSVLEVVHQLFAGFDVAPGFLRLGQGLRSDSMICITSYNDMQCTCIYIYYIIYITLYIYIFSCYIHIIYIYVHIYFLYTIIQT